MNRMLWMAALAATLALPAASVSAHHSFAMFDMNKAVAVTATIKEFQWTAPHALLWVVEDPKPGEANGKMWAIELSTGPAPPTRVGWTKRSVAPGDRGTIELGPPRRGEARWSVQKA